MSELLQDLGINATFILTMTGMIGTGIGVLLTYFLKSRCTQVKCCCIECRRQPIELQPSDIEIVN